MSGHVLYAGCVAGSDGLFIGFLCIRTPTNARARAWLSASTEGVRSLTEQRRDGQNRTHLQLDYEGMRSAFPLIEQLHAGGHDLEHGVSVVTNVHSWVANVQRHGPQSTSGIAQASLASELPNLDLYLSCDEARVGAASPAQEFDRHELLRGDVLCQLDEAVGSPV